MAVKAKGFRFQRNDDDVLVLHFPEGHDLYGLEIKVRRRLPVGVMFGDEGVAVRLFVEQITGWNAEDDAGEAIEPSLESIGRLMDQEQLIAVIDAWKEQMTGVGAPLGVPSRAGR